MAADEPNPLDMIRRGLEMLQQGGICPPPLPPPRDPRDPPPDPGPGRVQLVTLDQCAAICGRKKSALQEYRKKGLFPTPANRGRRGMAYRWEWPVVRAWLEQTYCLRLPERYPGLTR